MERKDTNKNKVSYIDCHVHAKKKLISYRMVFDVDDEENKKL